MPKEPEKEMLRKTALACLMLLPLAGLAAPAGAQLGLPDVAGPVGTVVDRAGDAVGRIGETLGNGLDSALPLDAVRRLAADRLERLSRFVRSHRDTVEADDEGNPARSGVILMLDGDERAVKVAQDLGFAAGTAPDLGNLDLSAVELQAPRGMALAKALALLRKALPQTTFSADQIHFPAGTLNTPAGTGASAPPPGAAIRTAIGLIDGGVGPAIAITKARGFATGAPRASDHGTAIASLLHHAGARTIYAADVYGSDPAGGSALAIARALDWMVGERVPVVTISLAGPQNPLLGRAIAAADRRGTRILAAVGNDGPAAPPAYPASYPAVLAITGVDGQNRALIEAGKPLHLDYAAPGSDMKALDAGGRLKSVRGTSFAAPLAAARVAAQIDGGHAGTDLSAALDSEATDLGRKGPDPLYGRGLLCAACRRR